jgi:gluconolactonase
MKKIAVLLILVASIGLIQMKAQAQTDKVVVKFDPALDEIIAPDAKLELVRGDFGITEGPNWIQKGKSGYLVFTDIAANVIYKMTPDGKATVLVDHAGYQGFDPWNVGTIVTNRRDPKDPLFRQFQEVGADGLSVDKQGRIISATLIGRSIERIEKNGKRTVLVDHYEGKRLGGPNDVVVKRDGAIYYTDTTGGVRGPAMIPRKKYRNRVSTCSKTAK